MKKGAVAQQNLIQGVRELTRKDLEVLRETRSVPVVQRLRDPHHRLARMVAMGLKPSEAATQAGYSYGSLCLLQKDPSFIELIDHYRKIVVENFAESQGAYYELLTSNGLKAERHIAERIEEKEEAGELLSIREALAISRDAADRTGHGKKTTNVNVNYNFAERLERAAQRSARVIDAIPLRAAPSTVTLPGAGPVTGGAVSPPLPRQPIQRVSRRA